METQKIIAIIERAKDGTFGIYTDEGLTGLGSSLEEAKINLLEGAKVWKEAAIEEGLEYPSILDYELEFIYKFEVQSFLQYYSGIITPTALGNLSGINPKQIWNYMSGVSKPRQAQVAKIEAALHKLGSELTSISL